MYVQATWQSKDLKDNLIIGSLVEGFDWVDCANQCEKMYQDYNLKTMNNIPFSVDPWNTEGDVYICSYTDNRGTSKTIYVLAKSLIEAWDQVNKFEPSSIQAIKRTDTNYKSRPF